MIAIEDKKKNRNIQHERGSVVLFVTVAMLFFIPVAVGLYQSGMNQKSEQGTEVNRIQTQYNVSKEQMDRKYYDYFQNKSGKPDRNGIYTENGTIDGGEEGYKNPIIPKGFKPINVGEAKWEDNAIDKGLVIEDPSGNQFVWIAVDGTEVKLSRYTFSAYGVHTDMQSNAIAYSGYNFQEDTTNGNNTKAKSIQGFKTSVDTYGGYYIGRYEASNNGEKVASKSGAVWNNITQPDAAIKCRDMYDSTYGVTSDLMNSYAWDTALLYIQKYGTNASYSRQVSFNNSAQGLQDTGQLGDIQCNIYDMASNVLEWTTENSSHASWQCTARGGTFLSNAICASERSVNSADSINPFVGFRPLLYL